MWYDFIKHGFCRRYVYLGMFFSCACKRYVFIKHVFLQVVRLFGSVFLSHAGGMLLLGTILAGGTFIRVCSLQYSVRCISSIHKQVF